MRMPHRIGATLAVAALSLSLCSAVFAQKGQRRGGMAISPVLLASKLSLTEEQKTKLQSANDAFQAETARIRGLATPKERREANKANRETYQTALQGVLNADQKKQFEALTLEARDYQAYGQMGGRLVGLSLSDEQKGKIKEIAAKYQPDVQKLRDEQKTATDKKAITAQVRELNAKMSDEVKVVLNADQQKQFDATNVGKAKKKKKKKNL